MKRMAWFVVSSLAITAGLVACSSDSSQGVIPPNTGAAGDDGAGGDQGEGGSAGTGTTIAGSGGTNSQGGTAGAGTAGSGDAGSNTFGGPGPGGGAGASQGGAGSGQAGKGQAGQGQAGQGQAGAQSCGGIPAPATCSACIDAKCCAEGSACGAAANCLPFSQCLSTDKCTDKTCADSCGAKNPGGEEPGIALNNCLVTNCNTECSNSGQSCGVTFGKPACDTCLGANCCAQGQACAAEPQFATFNKCGAACKDQACITACENASPKGAAAYNTLIQCLGGGCKTECGL